MVSLDVDALRMVASGNLGGAREHMDKMVEKQRERDIKEWIQDNANLTLYDCDPLEPLKAAELLENTRDALKDDPQADPVSVFKGFLSDYLWDTYTDWEIDVSNEAAENLAKTFKMDFDEALDYIHNYASVSFPIDDLLDTSYHTVIMLDTGDSNSDFTANNVEPAYNGIPIEDISDEASLVWLAEKNGYSKEDFVFRLANNNNIPKDEHPFIHSVYENIENTSSSMNGVAFLGTMSLADLAKAQKEGVTVPKCTSCGLYDGWNGAGSPFDIKLQNDIVIPADCIFSCLPDCDYRLRYTVDDSYGFTDKIWKTQIFAGKAKEFEPEEIETAKALCENPPRIPAEKGTPSAFMQEKFANQFRSNLVVLGGIYDGMLDRGQFASAAKGAINRVSYETTGVGKKEYQFSETYFRELLDLAPCKLQQDYIDSYMKRFDKSQSR